MNISNKLYEKTKSNFIRQIIEQGTYASEKDFRLVLKEFDKLTKQMSDKTPEEMVNIIIEDSIGEFLNVLNSNLIIPGFTFGVKVNGINTKIYGGFKDNLGNKIETDTMFDIASITKIFTQVLIYKLIDKNIINFDDKVKDLHPDFINMDDITIRDITTFSVSFKTDGRIDSKNSIKEAKECLFGVKPTIRNHYNYNDIGMMIIKEVIEKVTNNTFEELLNQYIVEPLNLDNTKVNISELLRNKITGSSNMNIGMVNDGIANTLGGHSGHAGIWSNSDDLITFAESIMNGTILPEHMIQDFYYPGKFDNNRGIVGNTFIQGSKYVDKTSSLKSFAVQGSTRVQVNTEIRGLYKASATALLNSAIISEKKVKELEAQGYNINKYFKVDGKELRLNDIRKLVPPEKSSVLFTRMNAKTTLKLMFLDTLLQNYEKYYEPNINIEKDISNKLK